jgi:adenosylhomocysteine nucleosidase
MIHLLTALPAEAHALCGRRLGLGENVRLAPSLTLHVCGMGATAAGEAAARLTESAGSHPVTAGPALISIGVAGALATSLRAGDVLLADSVAGPATPAAGTAGGDAADAMGRTAGDLILACDRDFTRQLAEALVPTSLHVHQGRVLTTSRVLATPADKHDHSGAAMAVDMESVAIARIARDRAVPFVCVRVVVDEASMSLPQAALVSLREDGSVDPVRLATRLLTHPAELLPLIRLGSAFGHARRSLRALGPAVIALADGCADANRKATEHR